MSQSSMQSSELQPGSIDPSFGKNGVITPPTSSDRARAIAVAEDGTLTYAVSTSKAFWLCRTLANGEPDITLAGSGRVKFEFSEYLSSIPRRVLLQKNRKVVLIGNVQTSFFTGLPAVMGINEDGTPDRELPEHVLKLPLGHEDDVMGTYPSDGCLQEDGKILLTFGYTVDSEEVALLIRLKSNGETDPTFGIERGSVKVRFEGKDTKIASVVIQKDGRIIVGGTLHESKDGKSLSQLALARYEPNGRLDQTFGNKGYVVLKSPLNQTTNMRKLVLQEDKLVCVGVVSTAVGYECLLMRFNADGSPDPEFNGGNPVFTKIGKQWSEWTTAVVQSDNKIVVAGTTYDPIPDLILGRFNADGTPDTNFAGGGWVKYPASAPQEVVIQKSTGRIIIAGEGRTHTFVPRVYGFLG
ncbi:hypothetical protein [Pseudomonas frederiksbergensis]|uniref:hypothetical protein n=1 Tax=Pseudomonas frederiksbergensis TaxID=104087 RepID=UPI003D19984D